MVKGSGDAFTAALPLLSSHETSARFRNAIPHPKETPTTGPVRQTESCGSEHGDSDKCMYERLPGRIGRDLVGHQRLAGAMS